MIDDERHADAKRGDSHNTASIYDIKGAADDKPIFTLSAKNQAALKLQLERYRRFLDDHPDLP